MRRISTALLLIAVASTANAQDRPNVVIMLADNVGYGDIGAYGAGEVRGREALANYAVGYAYQVEKDYALFQRAVRSGRLATDTSPTPLATMLR